jgi:predicted ArsR family transcriptional regulator
MESDLSLLGTSKSVIVNYLSTGEKTGKELAAILKVNQTAIREHMLWLEKMGIVRSKFVRSGVGRPRKVYALTPLGIELLPKQYDVFLNVLIKKFSEIGGEELLGKVMAETVREFTTQNEQLAHLPLEERLQRVISMLNRLGFMASIRREGDNFVIERHNCIFNKTARLYPSLLCNECDMSFIKEPIGMKDIELVECIGKGGTSCRNLIKA